MPTVDVVDLKRQKVGSVELPEEVFGCKLHSALVHEADGIDTTSRRSCRVWKETMEAKAYRTSPGRVDPFSRMASWRVGIWAEAA